MKRDLRKAEGEEKWERKVQQQGEMEKQKQPYSGVTDDRHHPYNGEMRGRTSYHSPIVFL